MLIQGQCQHCAGLYEYDAESKSEFCPHCGKETFCTPSKIIAPPKIQESAAPPKLRKPGIITKPTIISRTRVWIFAGVFCGSTTLLFTVSALMSVPSDKENEDAKKIYVLQTKEDELKQKSDAATHAEIYGAYEAREQWQDYERNVNNQIQELFDNRVSLQAEKMNLAEQRNNGSNFAFVAAILCCFFWIPAAIYLFIVPER